MLGVERSAPGQRFPSGGGSRLLQRRQIAVVAGRPATILRGTGPSPSEQDGEAEARRDRSDAFDGDGMEPVVAEVIVVNEAGALRETQLIEGDETGVLGVLPSRVGIGKGIAFGANFELIQVIVLPAEGKLDQEVELLEGLVPGDGDTTPDGRRDAVNGDVKGVQLPR
jgi:hypothetical protein